MTVSLDKLNEKLILLCAIFSTMPIVALPIMGRTISLFTICLFIFVAINVPMLFRKHNLKLCSNESEKFLLIWLAWGIFSGICGMLYYNNMDSKAFATVAMSQIPKIVMYIVMIIIIYNSNLSKKYILKGLIIGCIINVVWASIDALLFYLFKISITNIIFQQFININNVRFGQISIILNGGGYRSSGLNTDPANIGFFAPIVFYYGLKKNNKILVVIALLSELASMSTTSLVCTVLVGFIYIFEKKKSRIHKSISMKTIVISIISIIVIGIFVVKFDDVLIKQLNKFLTRIDTVYVDGLTENNRVYYIKNFIYACKQENIRLLTGTGYLTASHGYIGTEINVYGPYDMENRYLANFFDLGIFGTVAFFYMLYLIYKRGKKVLFNDSEYANIFKAIFFSLIVTCAFYQYPLYTVHILFFASIASCSSEEKDTIDNNGKV